MSAPVIAVLPEHVIDQIAAGEVIERPASVVKELVDNAVDAGAGVITVETQGGGRGMIRVVDDGHGMAPDDLLLALTRHATSKIRRVEDLDGLRTVGFRGEALPSIASVSIVTITSRRRDDLAAARIVVEAGVAGPVEEVGAPVGTTIEVTRLFGNVPARLKFLKSEATEASHVTDLVGRLAMAHPQLHVRLRHNGRTALELPPDRDGRARAEALLGPRVAGRMIAVSGEEGGVRVEAYLAAPELAQTTARGVQLYVGRRPIRDRGVLHAVTMGYGELIPRGRYPVAVVLLDVPAGLVDLNVHPQKAEVRFADAAAVHATVRHVLQAGVGRAPWRGELGGGAPIQMTALTQVAPPRLRFDGGATDLAQRHAAQLGPRAERAPDGGGWRPAATVVQRSLALDEPTTSAAPGAAFAPVTGAGPRGGGGAGARAWAERLRAELSAARAKAGPAGPSAAEVLALDAVDGAANDRGRAGHDAAGDDGEGDGAGRGRGRDEDAGASWADAHPRGVVQPGYFAGLRYLGQLDLTYLVCEGDGELVLIDQHAAHERVELARLRARAPHDVPTQRLLFPATIDATPAQLALVEELAPVLARVGFEAEPFGKATIAIKAVPAGLRDEEPATLLGRVLGEWAATGAAGVDARLDAMLATIACHSVVRAGDRLAVGEIEVLLRGMDGADQDALGPLGPHGRPVLMRLALAEIGRRFGR